MAPGAKNKFGVPVVGLAPSWSKFGAPMVEPELFRNEIYCTEESSLLVTMLGLFGASRSK